VNIYALRGVSKATMTLILVKNHVA